MSTVLWDNKTQVFKLDLEPVIPAVNLALFPLTLFHSVNLKKKR